MTTVEYFHAQRDAARRRIESARRGCYTKFFFDLGA
jgi:hypothetical protein